MAESLKCVFCSTSDVPLTLFTEKTLEKCRTVLKHRKEHNLKFMDVVLPVDLFESGYHRQCYKSFTGLMKKYYMANPTYTEKAAPKEKSSDIPDTPSTACSSRSEAAGDPRVPQTSQLSLEEIKELLESKLSDLQTQLHHLRATEANNPIGWLPGKNLEQTKKVLIQTLINRVTPQYPDFRSSGELLFKTVLEKLEMQFKETTWLIDSEKRVLNQLNGKLNSLQEKIASFDNMVAARLVSGEMKQAENLDKIQKQLEVELRKHKHMLKHVVNVIYPGNQDIKQLLAVLIESYLENPKDYIELTSETDCKTLTKFLPVGLVVWHPYDKMKVKLGEGQ